MVPSSLSVRELQAFFSELLIVFNLQCHNSSEALSLSLSTTASESHLREQSSNCLLCFIFSVLSELLYFIFIILDSLISFCNLSFSSIVLSLEHRHSLCSETGLVRETPDQKLASVPCVARTELVLQHLIKPLGDYLPGCRR